MHFKLGMQIAAGALVLAVLSFVPFTPFPAHNTALAQLPFGPEIPFGGANSFAIFCTCSANFLLPIFDYATIRPLLLVYQPGVSRLYLYYNIYGRFLLGSYAPVGSQCLMYVGTGCVRISSNGMLGFLPGTGTSL